MATTIAAGLLTPALSSEIQAKPGAPSPPMDRDVDIDASFPFSLPPAAISNTSNPRKSSEPARATVTLPPSVLPKAKRPASSRRRWSAANNQQNGYSLPPPPTRSRKIIQMNPRAQKEDRSTLSMASVSTAFVKESTATNDNIAASATSAATKRKYSTTSPATTAGRKMARKTAHSLIERRRRSKMNEEFGVLKDMIPACLGQEMHKLAILQASIEYMRYLEKCLADLKAAHSQCESGVSHHPPSPPPNASQATTDQSTRSSSATSEETEPAELPPLRYVFTADPPCQSYFISQPPVIAPIAPIARLLSPQSSPLQLTTSYNHPPLPLSGSSLPGPAYEPPSGAPACKSFSFLSPVIAPNDDHEATAALLMLNTDRRRWGERECRSGASSHRRIVNALEQTSRGISVKDLLTT